MKTFKYRGTAYGISKTDVNGLYEVRKVTRRLKTTIAYLNDSMAYDYCDLEDDDDTTPNARAKRIAAQKAIMKLFRKQY